MLIMGKQQLKELTKRIPEIEQEFTMEYCPTMYFGGREAGLDLPTIRNSEKYQNWRALIEANLDELPQTKQIDELRLSFKKIDGGWTEKTAFNRLKAQLNALNEYLDIQDDHATAEDIFSEDALNNNILHACVEVQGDNNNHGKQEDEINDKIRSCLRMLYDVYDQTRQGVSESGKKAGEIDFLIKRAGIPVAIFEALRMSALTKDNLTTHVNKVLDNYDPVGCPFAFVMVYVTAGEFATFWNKLFAFLQEFEFPYERQTSLNEIETGITEIRRAKITLKRSDKDVVFYVYAMNMK